MNGTRRGARGASPAGKNFSRSDPRPQGMLSAQAHDFPAGGQRDPKGRWGAMRCHKTEITIQNSSLIPHNPAPRNASETHGLREYDISGSPDAWVTASKSFPLTESAKRACALLSASRLLVAHAHCKALGAAGSSATRLRRGWASLPQDLVG